MKQFKGQYFRSHISTWPLRVKMNTILKEIMPSSRMNCSNNRRFSFEYYFWMTIYLRLNCDVFLRYSYYGMGPLGDRAFGPHGPSVRLSTLLSHMENK